MANETVGSYVVVLAKCEASGMEQWAFLDTDRYLKLPIFKMRFFNMYPFVKAARSVIHLFEEIRNLELEFELKGDYCNIKIYETILKFQKATCNPTGMSKNIKWHDPLSAMTSGRLDDLSFQIIELIAKTKLQMIEKSKDSTQDHHFQL